ncbi:MAG: hypothetical protein PHO27_12300 [Sulfuricurvum sp.]|nr:hypothetical protein [Sulfuricurvum sp.]
MYLKIEYPEIIYDYQNIDNFLKDTVPRLLDQKSPNSFKVFDLNSTININGSNKLKPLHEFKNCCGVYMFLSEDNEPVYVGFGGERNQDLFERIAYKQFRGDTLVKNIKEIETSFNKDMSVKQILITYTPKLLVIPVGKLNEKLSIKKAKILETVLIALLNCKYNK